MTGGGGRGRSRIIRPQESQGLFKSFNTLWMRLTLKVYNACQTVGEVSAVYQLYSVQLRRSFIGDISKLFIMKTRRNTLRTEAMHCFSSQSVQSHVTERFKILHVNRVVSS
jgi:hypothetical protein